MEEWIWSHKIYMAIPTQGIKLDSEIGEGKIMETNQNRNRNDKRYFSNLGIPGRCDNVGAQMPHQIFT